MGAPSCPSAVWHCPAAAMALNVLFGSGLLPRTAQRFAGGAASAVGRNLARPMTSLRIPTVPRTALVPSVRCYGTRSVWNVAQGNRSLFIWIVVWTAVAGLAQEVVGPFIVYHEPGAV